jgi:putative acetyltransferase
VPITVRPFQPEDARTFLDIHSRSVRGLATSYYASEVIEAWAVAPTEANVRDFLTNSDDEIRLIAELDGTPAGIGALVAADSELRACYVVPEAARKGVGSALVHEIERRAKAHGVTQLQLVASINAEKFYAALGYVVVERTEHVLRNGEPMAAVKMRKALNV